MKTQIVYSIISYESDHYLEQLMISILSLRTYNPDAHIIVVTNKETSDSLVGWRSTLKNIVEEIKVVDIPENYNNMQRSRFLKTNLRHFISGDYLFIDTDTIICGSLVNLDRLDADIALCADCNADLLLSESTTIALCKKAGFGLMEQVPYFNSGVMFVRDSKVSSNFYKEWFENWKYSSLKGINYDQPSLNYVNHQLGNIIKEIPGEWNCQIYFKGWNYLHKALIIHYAGGGKKDCLNKLYQMVRTQGISNPKLNSLVLSPKIKFYAYLTNQLDSSKSMFLLWFYVHFNKLYHVIFG